MARLNLRGPSKMGACNEDEGALTRAVVASFEREDGSAGHAWACRVWEARRVLWRACEVYAPKEMAAALRARATEIDPESKRLDATNRGGVAELRLALAEWLDPPVLCRFCSRVMPEPRAARDSAGPADVRPAPPRPCSARQLIRGGIDRKTGARVMRPQRCLPHISKDGRCGTLALFLPPPLPGPVTEAMHKAGGRHDVISDRDGQALLTASTVTDATHVAVRVARKRFDWTMNRACSANGRLFMKAQAQYYAADGTGITRADLLQEAALGGRRALMDFDPTRGFQFSSYALNWVRQGMSAIWAKRHEIKTPAWVVDGRREVERKGVQPRELLAAIEALAESSAHRRPVTMSLAEALVALVIEAETIEEVPGSRPLRKVRRLLLAGRDPLMLAVEAAKEAAPKMVGSGTKRRQESLELAIERVAAVVSAWLELDLAGGATLTVLRTETASPMSAALEDATGVDDSDEAATSTRHRSAVLVDGTDLEALAAAEQEATLGRDALYAGLAHLQQHDREGAEIIRRYHGLEGPEETLQEIADAPLRCTGRTLCRERMRQKYREALQHVKRHLQEMGAPVAADDDDGDFSPVIVPRSPWRPVGPAAVEMTKAAMRQSEVSSDDAPFLSGVMTL